MENKVCMNCGAPNPENDVSFLVVDANSTSTTAKVNYKTTRTTTVTTEKLSGADRYVVCNRCVGQKRRSNAVGMGILGVLGGFMVGILFFGMIDYFSKGFFNSHVPFIMAVCAIAGVAAAVYNVVTALREPAPFVAQRMLRKARGGAAMGKVYVPADREAYRSKNQTGPDINVFHQKSGLRTAVGDALFLQVIAPGKGNEAVDQLLAQSSEHTNPGDENKKRLFKPPVTFPIDT